MKAQILIGTSGWHYNDWIGTFYPADIRGYNELRFHAQHFSTVENNSSFYRIASENTYKTWDRMTPENYRFSMKVNRLITHDNRLELTDEVMERIRFVLSTTQILKEKLGAIVIQLPPSFRYDPAKLTDFLEYFRSVVNEQVYKFDVAIEFRNMYWFTPEVYSILEKYNVALVAGQSSRYPEMRRVTADIAYIRMHGPEKLFASSYSDEQLEDWAEYIRGMGDEVRRVYVYFNNDYYGYAITNAKSLMQKLGMAV